MDNVVPMKPNMSSTFPIEIDSLEFRTSRALQAFLIEKAKTRKRKANTKLGATHFTRLGRAAYLQVGGYIIYMLAPKNNSMDSVLKRLEHWSNKYKLESEIRHLNGNLIIKIVGEL